MAFTSRNDIVVHNASGYDIGMVPDETLARGDVVQMSATNNYQVELSDSTGDIVFGVVREVSFNATTGNDTGQSEARIRVGGIVFAKVASGAQTIGNTLTGGANGDFESGTVGTHHISAVVVDPTTVDTDYCLVRLLG